jgi:hypothetical protein
MGGDTHMHDPPGAMLQKHEHIKDPKRYRHHDKEVTGQDGFSVIAKKSGPSLIAPRPA